MQLLITPNQSKKEYDNANCVLILIYYNKQLITERAKYNRNKSKSDLIKEYIYRKYPNIKLKKGDLIYPTLINKKIVNELYICEVPLIYDGKNMIKLEYIEEYIYDGPSIPSWPPDYYRYYILPKQLNILQLYPNIHLLDNYFQLLYKLYEKYLSFNITYILFEIEPNIIPILIKNITIKTIKDNGDDRIIIYTFINLSSIASLNDNSSIESSKNESEQEIIKIVLCNFVPRWLYRHPSTISIMQFINSNLIDVDKIKWDNSADNIINIKNIIIKNLLEQCSDTNKHILYFEYINLIIPDYSKIDYTLDEEAKQYKLIIIREKKKKERKVMKYNLLEDYNLSTNIIASLNVINYKVDDDILVDPSIFNIASFRCNIIIHKNLILELPKEIINNHILIELSLEDIGNLLKTCKFFYNIINSNNFWRIYYCSHFINKIGINDKINYKDIYFSIVNERHCYEYDNLEIENSEHKLSLKCPAINKNIKKLQINSAIRKPLIGDIFKYYTYFSDWRQLFNEFIYNGNQFIPLNELRFPLIINSSLNSSIFKEINDYFGFKHQCYDSTLIENDMDKFKVFEEPYYFPSNYWKRNKKIPLYYNDLDINNASNKCSSDIIFKHQTYIEDIIKNLKFIGICIPLNKYFVILSYKIIIFISSFIDIRGCKRHILFYDIIKEDYNNSETEIRSNKTKIINKLSLHKILKFQSKVEDWCDQSKYIPKIPKCDLYLKFDPKL